MTMVEKQYLNVLKMIVTRLTGSDINWALTGSLGIALQGINLQVHDIDLQTDKKGAYEIERCLSEFVVKPVRYTESERIRSYYGVFEIHGITVEVMGAIQKRLEDHKWEKPVRVEPYRHWIQVDEMQVPVLSLTYEYQAYLLLGREDKAEILRQWLRGDPGS